MRRAKTTNPRHIPIEHGTYKGYQQHIRQNITPCTSCREANATYIRRYRRSTNATQSTRLNLDTLAQLLETATDPVVDIVRAEIGYELVDLLRSKTPA